MFDFIIKPAVSALSRVVLQSGASNETLLMSQDGEYVLEGVSRYDLSDRTKKYRRVPL